MQYMLMIYEDEVVYGPNKAGPAILDMRAKHMKFAQEIGAVLRGGAGLKSVSLATTVRTSNGAKTVHDGPFAETKEQLGGYYLVDVPDLDAAIALAKKVPLHKNGSIEVRPVQGME